MADDREKLIGRFASMRADLLDAIDGLDPGALTERSLDGWSVKDHLLHIAAWDGIRAGEIARISAGHEAVYRLSDEQEPALNGVLHEIQGELSLEQALWELEASHARLIDALGQATERGLEAARYGEAGLLSSHEAQHTGWIRRWRSERGL